MREREREEKWIRKGRLDLVKNSRPEEKERKPVTNSLVLENEKKSTSDWIFSTRMLSV